MAILLEHRRRQGELYRIERAARDAANAVSVVEEWAGEAKGILISEIRRNGPIEFDGRRYSVVKSGGEWTLQVVSADGRDL